MDQNKKIFDNAKWIVGCKILQSIIQLVVGMLTARYLGPENYGLIDYAASITAFASPVMQLGLQSILVQEYINSPEKEGEIIGTHLAMNVASAVACIIGISSFAAVANPNSIETITVCALYSTSLLFQAMDMMQYWFQAKLLSKYSSIAMLCAYVLVSVYKILLLILKKNVYWFAVSHSVEYAAIALFLLVAYRRVGSKKLKFSMQLSKEMFSKSKYYIVAMVMVALYNRMGNIFLKQFFGDAENGYYAAAVTCTGMTMFVFLAIIDTARPVVLESKKISREIFDKNVSKVYSLIIWLSFGQSAMFTLLAEPIIRILYGNAYTPAIAVLRILVWSTAFSYIGYVRNIWILGEEKHSVLWKINLSGAVSSVVFNVILIARWGACGAAVATILTQLFTNVLTGYILKPVRKNNLLLIEGVNPRLILEIVKQFANNKEE